MHTCTHAHTHTHKHTHKHTHTRTHTASSVQCCPSPTHTTTTARRHDTSQLCAFWCEPLWCLLTFNADATKKLPYIRKKKKKKKERCFPIPPLLCTPAVMESPMVPILMVSAPAPTYKQTTSKVRVRERKQETFSRGCQVHQ